MIQTRNTIRKLLRKHGAEGLLREIAWEIEQEANHLNTIGAPMKAGCMFAEVSLIHGTARAIEEVWKHHGKDRNAKSVTNS